MPIPASLLSVGAIFVLSSAGLAQTPRVLVKSGDAVAGPSGSYTVAHVWFPFQHRGGGRGAHVDLVDGAGVTVSGFWGKRLGEPDEVLRVPAPVAGVMQSWIGANQGFVTEAGEDVYNAVIDGPAGSTLGSLWIDDQIQLRDGDPAPGLPGLVVGALTTVVPIDSGGALIHAQLAPSSGGPTTAANWLWPQTTPILASGMQLPGFTLPLNDHFIAISSGNSHRVAVSRSGSHRLLTVSLDTGAVSNEPRGMTLDELPLFVDGLVLETGQPVPASILPQATWNDFFSAWINDLGSWHLVAWIVTPTGSQRVLIQDGAVLLRSGDTLPGVGLVENIYGVLRNDAGDRLMGIRSGGSNVLLWNGAPLFSAGDPVDVDGDGLADPGYSIASIPRHTGSMQLDEDGSVRVTTTLSTPTGFAAALVEVRGYGLGSPVCSPAILNSTGAPGEIAVGGSAIAGGRPLWLRASELPTNQFGYFLTSQSQSFVAGPGGSQGNLCLGGTIGRFVAQVASTASAGSIAIEVDTSAIPLSPAAPILPGQRWTFQLWYRDFNPGPTSNFTDAVEVTFD